MPDDAGADSSNEHFVGHIVVVMPVRCVQGLLSCTSILISLWSMGQPMNNRVDIKIKHALQRQKGEGMTAVLYLGKIPQHPSEWISVTVANGIRYWNNVNIGYYYNMLKLILFWEEWFNLLFSLCSDFHFSHMLTRQALHSCLVLVGFKPQVFVREVYNKLGTSI